MVCCKKRALLPFSASGGAVLWLRTEHTQLSLSNARVHLLDNKKPGKKGVKIGAKQGAKRPPGKTQARRSKAVTRQLPD